MREEKEEMRESFLNLQFLIVLKNYF